jgi:hypothetical protein
LMAAVVSGAGAGGRGLSAEATKGMIAEEKRAKRMAVVATTRRTAAEMRRGLGTVNGREGCVVIGGSSVKARTISGSEAVPERKLYMGRIAARQARAE